jgi:hypothetical protein
MSQLIAVVIYSSDPSGDASGGQRAHDHVFLTRDPKPHLDRLEELYQKPLNAFDDPASGRTLYSTDSWDPTEAQKSVGFSWNYEARVVAHTSNKEL